MWNNYLSIEIIPDGHFRITHRIHSKSPCGNQNPKMMFLLRSLRCWETNNASHWTGKCYLERNVWTEFCRLKGAKVSFFRCGYWTIAIYNQTLQRRHNLIVKCQWNLSEKSSAELIHTGTCKNGADRGFPCSVVSQENSDLPLVQVQAQILDCYVFTPSPIKHL